MKARFSLLAIVAAILIALANPILSRADTEPDPGEKLRQIGQKLAADFGMRSFSGLWYEKEFSRYYANEGMAVGLIRDGDDSMPLKCVKIILFQGKESDNLSQLFEFAYRELILARHKDYNVASDKKRLAVEVGWALGNVRKMWAKGEENDLFKTPCHIYITAQRVGNLRVVTMRTWP